MNNGGFAYNLGDEMIGWNHQWLLKPRVQHPRDGDSSNAMAKMSLSTGGAGRWRRDEDGLGQNRQSNPGKWAVLVPKSTGFWDTILSTHRKSSSLDESTNIRVHAPRRQCGGYCLSKGMKVAFNVTQGEKALENQGDLGSSIGDPKIVGLFQGNSQKNQSFYGNFMVGWWLVPLLLP